MRRGFAIKVALGVLLTCARAPAEDLVRIKVGEKGLLSLRYKGVEYCDPSGAGEVGFTGAGTKLAPTKPEEAARELKDCLFLPEWATPRTYRCSAQFSYTPMTGYTRGVPEEIRAAWPDAFCAMGNLDLRDPGPLNDLLIAVKRGNLPVFDCFYPNTGAADAIREVYAKAGTRHAPRAVDQTVTAAPDQAARITLAATDKDGESLTFQILSQPSRGTLTGPDAKAGTVTYTPARGQTGLDTFTFKAADASGLNSNRGKVTIMVK